METTAKLEIVSIKIHKLVDDYPDTSWLGEYTDSKSDWAICCKDGEYVYLLETTERRRNELEDEIADLECRIENYGNGTNYSEPMQTLQSAIDKKNEELKALPENWEAPERGREFRYFLPANMSESELGSEDYQKYGKQDFQRMEALNNGEWYFLGIRADARISINGTLQTITSGGLGGIESDSDDSTIQEVSDDQLAELIEQLKALGFTQEQIDECGLGVSLTT